MKSSKYCWTAALLLVLCMLLPWCGVAAADVSDKEYGSFSATFNAGAAPLRSAEITLYRVADVEFNQEQALYHYTDAYAACGVDLDTLGHTDAAAQMLQFISDKGLTGMTGTTDDQGRVAFSQVPFGLYLVAQTNEVPYFSKSAPFFSCIPYLDGGQICYDVDATPKVSVEILIDLTVKKVWNDDGTGRPEQIQVMLSRGGQLVDTVTLSEENQWSYMWSAVPQSDDWTVREVEVPNYTPSYRREGNTFIVENTPKLVQTGQLKWPIPVLACLGGALLLTGVALGRKKQHAGA